MSKNENDDGGDWLDFDGQSETGPVGPDSPLYEPAEVDNSEAEETAERAGEPQYQYGKDEARADGSSDKFVKPGEYRFAPAMGSIAQRVSADTTNKTAVEAGGHKLTWWEDDSIVPKYPYLLLNPVAHDAIDNETRWADAFRFEKGQQFVICDSGGYQLISQDDAAVVDSPEEHDFGKQQIHPPTMLEWQVRNADVGPILDHPPNVMTGAKIPSNKALPYDEWYEDIFKPRLANTAEYSREMSERLEELRDDGYPGADDFKQLLVIHGRPAKKEGWAQWDHLHEWHHTIEEEMVGPDAYALKPQPSNSLGQMAFQLAYAAIELEDKTDYVHVLQCGGQTQRILLDYFTTLVDLFVTSDASSHIQGTVWREFDVPGSWSSETLSLSDRSDTFVDRLPCRCVVCSRAAEKWDAHDVTVDNSAEDGQWINMHNLHQALMLSQTISALLRKYGPDVVDMVEITSDKVKPLKKPDPEEKNEFWALLRKKLSHHQIEHLHTAMQVVRDAAEGGEEAVGEWRFEWSSQDQDNEPVLEKEADAMGW